MGEKPRIKKEGGEKPRNPQVEATIEEARKRLEKTGVKAGKEWEETLREFEEKQIERGGRKAPQENKKVEDKKKYPNSGGLAAKMERIDNTQ